MVLTRDVSLDLVFSWLDLRSVGDMRSVGVLSRAQIIDRKCALLFLNVFNFLIKFGDLGFENIFVYLGELFQVTLFFNKHSVYYRLVALAVDSYKV